MKKATVYLLLLSTLGLITSLILFAVKSSFFIALDLLCYSLISTCVSISLYIIQKKKSKLSGIFFYVGIMLIILFIYLSLIPEKFSQFWPIELSGLTILITAGILQLLKGKTDIISKVSRFCFLSNSILLIFISLTNQSFSIFYSILFVLLTIGSITLILSSIKNTEVLLD